LGNGSIEINGASGAIRTSRANLKEIPTISALVIPVVQQFENFVGDQINQELDHWQDSFEFVPPGIDESGPGILGDKTGVVTLVARGAVLPNGDWLLVFDDISQIISAQRTQAWGEVAKRLAHEIKNPLTPIQLSAERLASKLQGKVDATDQNLLNKSVKTIVDQVDAMKRLVNEFREFGRMPQADLKPLDLNSLIKEVLSLYEAENDGVIIKSIFDAQCPNILGDEQLLRQVIHNLLQNAQDSIESLARREIVIETEWRERSKRVRMSVSDSGTGFTEAVLQRAFEPYVTTKAKGTGLGLAVVKKIADEHNARIELRNTEDHGAITGARVAISFQSEKIGSVNMTQIEKA
jgi:nitrogen fixation/metabolism regulation signal transduction histidine kinase